MSGQSKATPDSIDIRTRRLATWCAVGPRAPQGGT